MNKLPIIVFVLVLLFLLADTFVATMKQPKITVTTPKVVIQQPAPKIVEKRVVVKQKVFVQAKPIAKKGVLTKLKELF